MAFAQHPLYVAWQNFMNQDFITVPAVAAGAYMSDKARDFILDQLFPDTAHYQKAMRDYARGMLRKGKKALTRDMYLLDRTPAGPVPKSTALVRTFGSKAKPRKIIYPDWTAEARRMWERLPPGERHAELVQRAKARTRRDRQEGLFKLIAPPKEDSRALFRTLRFIDYTALAVITNQVTGTTKIDPATVLSYAGVPKGQGPSTRQGRQILVRSLHFRGHLKYLTKDDNTATGDPISVRLVVVQDTQTNGASYTPSDLFLNEAVGPISPFSYRNLCFSNRFKILATRRFELVPKGITGAIDGINYAYCGDSVYFEIDLDMNTIVHHTGTSANITDIQDHSYHLYCDSTNSSTVNLRINLQSRCRYLNK